MPSITGVTRPKRISLPQFVKDFIKEATPDQVMNSPGLLQLLCINHIVWSFLRDGTCHPELCLDEYKRIESALELSSDLKRDDSFELYNRIAQATSATHVIANNWESSS